MTTALQNDGTGYMGLHKDERTSGTHPTTKNVKEKMEGAMQEIGGIQIFEDKNMEEGRYLALDKNGLPIKSAEIGKTPIAKIVVKNIETFKLSMKYNGINL